MRFKKMHQSIEQFKKALALGILLLISTVTFSDPQVITPSVAGVKSIPLQMMAQTVEDKATLWGLSIKDYERYVWLMQNTPSGHWYKSLDPAEVLALNADNASDMMKYATIQAKAMHDRVTHELAFDRLYAKAYQALYPNEKPIMSKETKNLNSITLQAGDHVWLFINPDTPLASFLYQDVMQVVQTTPNTVLDIYFVGKEVSQKSIEAWAVSAHIPPGIINKEVTLNYGNQRFESLTKGKEINLPLVGIVHNAHFQPMSVSSILSLQAK